MTLSLMASCSTHRRDASRAAWPTSSSSNRRLSLSIHSPLSLRNAHSDPAYLDGRVDKSWHQQTREPCDIRTDPLRHGACEERQLHERGLDQDADQIDAERFPAIYPIGAVLAEHVCDG